MATVTVLKFPTVTGAEEALQVLTDLQEQHLIKVHDAALVTWPAGRQGPQFRQLVDFVGIGALNGMFWGLLLGCIFFTPFFGLAFGAAFGALAAAFRDYGIYDSFIQRVRSEVTEGTSALFLMTGDAVLDRVAEAMKQLKFEIISSNLSREDEQRLRTAFGQDEVRADPGGLPGARTESSYGNR
jgi:uncharacterized membrane protein